MNIQVFYEETDVSLQITGKNIELGEICRVSVFSGATEPARRVALVDTKSFYMDEESMVIISKIGGGVVAEIRHN
ncbi:MAG: hypothetical protein NTZ13_03460 [Candidatus Parcubacteria bacterium]|nr:hypothetical protein [Candidatus Parcubacteria bacterium]